MTYRTINGYVLVDELQSNGAGQCKWGFAEKDGREYFIKQFLAPTYPVEGSPGSLETKALKKERCQVFELRHRNVMKALRAKTKSGGNLVGAHDFFREGPHYFKITDKVDTSTMDVSTLHYLDPKSIGLVMRTVSHSLSTLHSSSIVHADLKPDNILIKQSREGVFVAKLIDFDSSFFENAVPELSDEIVGDVTYYSPELSRRIMGDDVLVTTKSDIYALGLVFHQYLTGKLPPMDESAYRYRWEASLNGESLELRTDLLGEKCAALIGEMLSLDPAIRPDAPQVLRQLKDVTSIKDSSVVEELAESITRIGGKLSTRIDAPEPSSGVEGLRLRGRLATKRKVD